MAGELIAANTGKIAGKVIDKQTGDPLIGANVVVEGTDLGAATGEKGRYYIIQVPPGTYSLQCSYIGYHTLTVKEVRVTSGLTTEINFELESEAIESPTVEVVAERSMVQKDVTSTRRTTTREDIEVAPGIEETTDILRLQSGAIISDTPQKIDLGQGQSLQVRDESLKNIHIRGGRGGEILYMVDGMPVTHPIYGGRSVLDLNVVSVKEVELLTGAFNAEYGHAQSGVINITTRSGTREFQGGIEYKTDEMGLFGSSYDMQYTSFHLGGPEPITSGLLPQIGLDIPGNLSFFLSGNGKFTNTAHNNGRTRAELFELPLLDQSVKERQSNNGGLNLKLDYDALRNLRFVLSYNGSWRRWSDFDWLWKNYPDHTADFSRDNHNINFRINHTLSKDTFYNLNFGYLDVKYHGSLNGRNPADYWYFGIIEEMQGDSIVSARRVSYQEFRERESQLPDSLTFVGSTIQPTNTDELTGFIDAQSYQNIWRNDHTKTYTMKGDLTSQIHPDHLIKTGFQVQMNDLEYVDIQGGGVNLSQYGDYIWGSGIGTRPPRPPGPFPEFARNRWVFNSKPVVGGTYIQDKFEQESLIINAGVRLDWFLPGQSIQDSSWKAVWRRATGLETDWKWYKYKISPRFGVSYPISTNTVIFFSYGHFNQLPELQYYYRDPYTGSFTGNPHLDYVQTITYEFGFTHQFSRNWALDIKNYEKDISQQVGTTPVQSEFGQQVHLYDNNGYARARGLEFELNKRYSNFTRGRITYTLQWAYGYSSSAFQDYVWSQTDFPKPIRERRLNWDVRHRVVLNATLVSPKGQHMNLFGLTLPDKWNLTMLYSFNSGRPYTPGTIDPVERQKLYNTASGPIHLNTDLKFEKTFNWAGVKFGVFINVYDLWHQRNVRMNFGFNQWTGEPYKFGDHISNTDQLYNWPDMYRMMDPRQYDTGRHTELGVKVEF